jgi:hypothetical protein
MANMAASASWKEVGEGRRDGIAQPSVKCGSLLFGSAAE